MTDIAERKLWGEYMAAYEDMVRSTSRQEAPWYVVPADNKPFTRLVVAAAS
jgi:polyphosphate kinase 2 (PPK2 family)